MSPDTGTTFWLGLIQIIGIDIVLSGDNAVVIALASRSLPPHLQRRAIVCGTIGAVVMRISLATLALELLRVPYLKLVGALLLLWIGVKLLLPETEGSGDLDAGNGFLSAIKTVMIADLVMSLDNVIGVAAAAKSSIALLAFGLALSIPLVIFGSTMLLRLMERVPSIVTLGAAVLGYVAGEMAVTDPAIHHWISVRADWLTVLMPPLAAVFVIAAGKWLALRRGNPTREIAEENAS